MGSLCQSCGMPMKKDPNGGGSKADGSRSTLYCSFCFQNGHFTQPDWSAAQMQTFCVGKMREMGFPRFLGWLFTRNIPKLQRWRAGAGKA